MVIYFDLCYLVLGVAFTIVVSRLLKRHGSYFLSYIFPKKSEGSQSLMALMDLGFYLINFGYIFIRMAYGQEEFKDAHEMIKVAAGYFGWQCLLVGIVHIFNMILFSAKLPKRKMN